MQRRELLLGASSALFMLPTLSYAAWQTKQPLPYRVQEIYPTLHDGKIIVAGGLSPDRNPTRGVSSSVISYDPKTDTWSSLADLPEPRHHPFLVSYQSKLYGFSGFIGKGDQRWYASNDVLVLEDKKWRKSKVKMPFAMCETVAAVINDKIHLVSGRTPLKQANGQWSHHSDIDSHLVFDPATEQWTDAPAIPTARNSACSALVNNLWYVIGGRTVNGGNLATNEVYDVKNNQWQTRAPMPQAQGGLAAAAVGENIYVFGGEFFDNGGGVYKKVWQYDTNSDQWAQVGEMPVPRHGLGAVAIDNNIYVIAGAAKAGASETSDRLSVYKL
ncbi:galactose oxidase [Aliikangiella marina]|uniref:Galactose oxidase n=1 Tax=Aliikangiella marina TaxID=1712262 RepID=A0A545TA60_9GAMM|nr:kelch repeat-containing protein [Aliikangiella marina]TQV74095.1 galactose oxidase [Aliikangiella marina]